MIKPKVRYRVTFLISRPRYPRPLLRPTAAERGGRHLPRRKNTLDRNHDNNKKRKDTVFRVASCRRLACFWLKTSFYELFLLPITRVARRSPPAISFPNGGRRDERLGLVGYKCRMRRVPHRRPCELDESALSNIIFRRKRDIVHSERDRHSRPVLWPAIVCRSQIETALTDLSLDGRRRQRVPL